MTTALPIRQPSNSDIHTNQIIASAQLTGQVLTLLFKRFADRDWLWPRAIELVESHFALLKAYRLEVLDD